MNKLTLKNFLEILYLVIAFLIVSQDAKAQNNLVPNIVPPSPEAASLGKFVEVPVSHYTGLPNISVPLYTIESGEIKLPIQVSYHARGIQVSETASQVGIGWALNAGGVITRQQRGPADESNYGYLTENFYDTFFTSETTRQRVYDQSLYGIDSDNLIDMEPDVYMFNFLNFSGKFMFDQKTKLPVIQKYSDFKIVPIYQTAGRYAIKGWIITDKDGIQYYFGTSKDGLRTAIDKPQSTSSYLFLSQGGLQTPSNSSPYNNAWQLMDIVTPSNKHIKFEYVKDQPNYFSRGFDDGPASALNSHFSRIVMDQYHIKTITFDKGKVVFTKSAAEREDLRYSFALQKIEVFGTDNIIKAKHTFNYTYTNSEDTNVLAYLKTTEPQAKKRMFLESILSEGSPAAASKSKKHSFVYDSQILPNRFSTAQDAWGYYNGKNNGEFSSFFEGDNRQVDTIKSQAGMLKKIIYPTGGSASFEYEHNKVIPPSFYDQLLLNPTTPTAPKGFVMFKSDSLYNNMRYTKRLIINGPDSEKVTLKYNITLGNNPALCSTTSNNATCPFEIAVYKVNPRGSVGNLYSGNNGSIILEPGEYEVEVTPKTVAGHNPNDIDNDNFIIRLNWNEPISNENEILYAAGKRIKRILWDDNQGGITSKTYKYLDSSGKSSGKTFSIPNMYHISDMVNGIPVVNQFGATAGSPLTNFQGNSLGYSVVTEIDGEKNNNIGKTEYTFTIPNDTGDFYKFPYHSPTDNEWLRGMPLTIRYYSNNAGSYALVKTVENKYIYGDASSSPIYFTEMIDPDLPYLYLNHRRKFSLPLIIFTKDESLSGSAAYQNPNSYKIFYTTGGTVDLASSEEVDYMKDSNQIHKKTENFYNYDSNYQLKSTQTKSSNDETLLTKYFYAPDAEMAGEPFRNDLISDYRRGTVLATQTFRNGAKLSEQKTVYDKSSETGNLLLPKFIYSNKGANAISEADKKITFDKYDDKGNILQYTPESGIPVSIIWGYNKTQPIAKIENTFYSSIPSGTISSVQGLSDADNDNCTLSSCSQEMLRNALNTFRNTLPEAFISTYTYDQLVGVTSITDPKGISTYYEYDFFNRLKFVKDKDQFVLQKYCYNYKGEQTDCSDNTSSGILYKSAAISGSFQKDNCSAGGSGSYVNYSLAAGAVTSNVSQADADQQASLRFNDEGQAHANTSGDCTFQSAALSGSFQKSNCSAGGNGSYVSYSLPLGAVTSNISQADADQKASLRFNDEGQSNANAYGDCTFQSAAISGSFQKNNCSAGGLGSYVAYSLPLGAVTLKTSQADVDQQASARFNSEGQSNANAYGDCTFQSAAISGPFQKNNCSAGGTGSYVGYSLPVGAITLKTSQADADQQAAARFNSEGQANANANGYCTFYSTAFSGSFTKNNCSAGGYGSTVGYSQNWGVVSSTISQADANALGSAKFYNDGQVYANANGYCTFYSTALSGSFTKNNCSTGGYGSTVGYSQNWGVVSSTISQADADASGSAKFYSDGQTYANANGYCTFYSTALSGSFQKNNCPVGGTGTYVNYSLPYGAVTLHTSQADADQQAAVRFNSEGRANANANGACIFYNTAKSGVFTKNNCTGGAFGSVETYTIPAGSYSAYSQEAADNAAQNIVNNNGQDYANSTGRCIFRSAAKSRTLSKNDCPPGGTGSVETYSLPAGAYSSELSQADADQKAQNVVDAVAQSYVNDIGYCTFYNTAKSGSFTKNDCPAGGISSPVVYNVPAGIYSSASSQAEADSQAQNDVNTNGQAYANANGVCVQPVYTHDYTYNSGTSNISINMRCSTASHPTVTFTFMIYYTNKTNNRPSFLRKSLVMGSGLTLKNEVFALNAVAGSITVELESVQ